MSNLLTKLTIAALLASASAPALAAPGSGIRLGGSEGRLHPFLDLLGRYDSNVYVTDAEKEVGDVIVHVRPGLKLEVPGDMTSVELMARLDWAQYLGNDDPATEDLSKLYAEAALGVTVNANGPIGLEVDDTFRRSDRPQALSFDSGLVSNYNDLEVRVPFRPGGGALTFQLNGGWSLETYEAFFKGANTSTCAPDIPGCDPAQLSKLGYNQFRGGASLAWKFLPRTSVIVEGGYFKRTPNDEAVAQTGSPGGYRFTAGLTGLITSHVSATVKAGYGSTTGAPAGLGDLGTFLATAEAEWQPTETTSVKLGYGHDLAVDPLALYTTDKVSLAARMLVAGRVGLALTAGWTHLGYSPGSDSSDIITASPAVDVEITRWLKAELAYAYTDRASSTEAAQALRDYTKSEAWLKLAATY